MPDEFVAILTSGGSNTGWTRPHHLLLESIAGVRDALQAEWATPVLIGEDHPDLPRALADDRIAAIIALNDVTAESQAILRAIGKPTIWADNAVWEPQRCLRRDELRAGQMVAQVAVGGGCTHLLYLCPSERNPAQAHYSHVHRLAGVRNIGERQGVPLEVLEVEDWWDPQPMQTIFETYTPTTAVICSNFYIADWLTAQILAAGLKLAEMPLFSCDDARKPLLHMIRMTRAGFDRYGMGVRAARMALQCVRAPAQACPSFVLEPTILPHNVAPPGLGDSLPEDDPLAYGRPVAPRQSAA